MSVITIFIGINENMIKKIILSTFLFASHFNLNAFEIQTSDNHTRFIFNSSDFSNIDKSKCSASIYLPEQFTLSSYITLTPGISLNGFNDQFNTQLNINNPEDKFFDMKLLGDNNYTLSSIPFKFKDLKFKEYDINIIGKNRINIFSNIKSFFGYGDINIKAENINFYNSEIFSQNGRLNLRSNNINSYDGKNSSALIPSIPDSYRIEIIAKNSQSVTLINPPYVTTSGNIKFCFENPYRNFNVDPIINELVIDAYQL